MRKVIRFTPALLAGICVLLLGSMACVAEQAEIPVISFTSHNGSCAQAEESSAVISVTGNKVVFSGSAFTPDPCHRLEAGLDHTSFPNISQPDRIIVDIAAFPGEQACIQCIGEVPFSGEVGPLANGEYEVSIVYDGDLLAQERITIE